MRKKSWYNELDDYSAEDDEPFREEDKLHY